MDHDTLQELARQRAQVDLRALKKVIRDHYKLYSAPLDHLPGALEIFELSLEHFVASCDRKTAVLRRVSADEVQQYASETAAIERQCVETQSAIDALKVRLDEARAERDRRIEYDAVARTIERLPSREQGTEQLVKLENDIRQLEAERTAYADTRAARQDNFDRIVDQLVRMREAIQEEKNEQARRRALEEEGDDDEDELVRKARREAEQDDDADDNDDGTKRQLDPNAAEFKPASQVATPHTNADDDIEMRGDDAAAGAEEGEEREEGEE